MTGGISLHAVDVANGVPAAGMRVEILAPHRGASQAAFFQESRGVPVHCRGLAGTLPPAIEVHGLGLRAVPGSVSPTHQSPA